MIDEPLLSILHHAAIDSRIRERTKPIRIRQESAASLPPGLEPVQTKVEIKARKWQRKEEFQSWLPIVDDLESDPGSRKSRISTEQLSVSRPE